MKKSELKKKTKTYVQEITLRMVIRSEVLQVPVKFTVKWNETTCANKTRWGRMERYGQRIDKQYIPYTKLCSPPTEPKHTNYFRERIY